MRYIWQISYYFITPRPCKCVKKRYRTLSLSCNAFQKFLPKKPNLQICCTGAGSCETFCKIYEYARRELKYKISNEIIPSICT